MSGMHHSDAQVKLMNNHRHFLWLLFAFFLLVGKGALGGELQSVDVSAVDRTSDGWLWLSPQARFAEETTPIERPQQALSSPELHWQNVSESVLNFGFGPPRYWIHLSLHNPGSTAVRRIIDIAEPLYDDLHIWVLNGNEELGEVRMGDRIPFASRPINYHYPAMTLDIPAHGSVDLVIRAHAHDGEHDPLPLRLWTTDAFHDGMQLDLLTYGAYYGAVLILLLYNLLVFASTRERGFLGYAVYLMTILAWNFAYRGFAFQYLWPESPDWNASAMAVLVPLGFAGVTIFSCNLLDLRRQTPWAFRISVILTLVALLHIPPALLAPEIGLFATLNPIGLSLMIVLLIAGARLAWLGNTTARIYVAAVGCMFLGTLPYYFTAFGLIAGNMLTIHAMNIGSALELLLLALALAHRINSLKTEKLEAEQLAFATLQHSAEILESRVSERTRELEQANRSLHELAVRDALTGLYNRRHFNEVVQQELARARRQETPIALLLLDLDLFKKLNDLSGHQAGDKALEHIGRLLSGFARRSIDQSFRIGGEEFAVLAPIADVANVDRWAEQLRQQIEAAAWPHPGSPHGHLTASIGVAVSRPGDTLESFYSRTDKALYQAKQAGRNCVILASD